MVDLHTARAVTTDTKVGNTLAWIKAIQYPEWMAEGACAKQIDLPPDLWFATGGSGPNPSKRLNNGPAGDAKAVCGQCPVRQQCLEYALESGEQHGIWGGLDQYERRALMMRNPVGA